jgi:hypothetical protein
MNFTFNPEARIEFIAAIAYYETAARAWDFDFLEKCTRLSNELRFARPPGRQCQKTLGAA